MAKAAKPSTTSSPLAELLREAGVPKTHIPKRLGTHRIAVLIYVPAAYFPRDYLEETAKLPFQSKLARLVTQGRLRVQDDGEGIILYEPIANGQPVLMEGAP